MSNNEYRALTQALIKYLDCPCTYFAPMHDDDPLMEAFRDAQQRGKEQGFTPVIVAAEDKTLLDCLVLNAAGKEGAGEDGSTDMDAVRSYRREILAVATDCGKEVLEHLISVRDSDCAEDGIDHGFDGAMATGDDVPPCEDRFYAYWDYDTGKTMPVVIAEIPTDKPWEIFAWLPFGNWNECPDTLDLMAICRHWFERFRAVPSVMAHDMLDFELPSPVPVTDVMRLAREQYAFCPDVIDSAGDDFNAGVLGAELMSTRFWSFWWD